MKILLVNDDGVHAPGIRILKEVLDDIAHVTIVAPLEERSTTGHTLSLGKPVRLKKLSQDIYGCSGYPADCTLLGVGEVFKDNPPDLVVSGINAGANLAQDVYYSGTVAGAREAIFQGVPAISVSLVTDVGRNNAESDDGYRIAANSIKKCIEHDVISVFADRELININVPCLQAEEQKGLKWSTPGFRYYRNGTSMRVDPFNKHYYWVGGQYTGDEDIPGSDCNVVSQGYSSLTALNFSRQTDDIEAKWSSFLQRLS